MDEEETLTYEEEIDDGEIFDDAPVPSSTIPVPAINPSDWRHLLTLFLLVTSLLFVLSQFGLSDSLLLRRGGSPVTPTVIPTRAAVSDVAASILDHLNISFKLPAVLSASQLHDLQTAIVQFIEEHVRQDSSTWKMQHDNLLAHQAELNEFRRSYQAIAKTLQSLKNRYENDLKEKDQIIKAERDKYAIASGSNNEELQRIRTTNNDLLQFVQTRKRSEEFLNETIWQEVFRLFDEMASPQPLIERAQTFRMWLLNTFVLSGDLHAEMNHWHKNLRTELEKIVLNGITAARAKQIALDAYEKFLADQTGLFDYALKAAGGSLESIRDTTPAQVPRVVTNIFGVSAEVLLPLSPDMVITPGFLPGQCWPFLNFPGSIVIKLAAPVRVTSFAMDYMPRRMSPTGRLLPAPKIFEVYGLNSVWDTEPFHFGVYEYEANHGDHIQLFSVQFHPPDLRQTFSHVELKILSNHGSLLYTSVCRFRVHGNVTDDPVQCPLLDR
ncbi:hypothetical protein RvY_06607 [Ramazzottius varieornatus]|uniref:SUN domain-containing protein n=1 Tax=Ramazzottius varieornatus TaxID=947166 RepID=A0A1D1V8R5_RAMVA|nr:hypothetical protein RvY_06607 [Ramazzottius varieornatus]